MTKRQRWTKGSVVKIDLTGRGVCFAQLLDFPQIVVFDGVFSPGADVSEINTNKILINITIYKDIITSGAWQKVGNAPISERASIEPMFFRQDPSSGELFICHSKFYNSGGERPASLPEVVELEKMIVWDAESVVNRLRAHYFDEDDLTLEIRMVDLSGVPPHQRF